jgi:hypothetical protein
MATAEPIWRLFDATVGVEILHDESVDPLKNLTISRRRQRRWIS